MKWFSTIQSSPSFEKAMLAAAREAKQHLGTRETDLGLLFLSSRYRSEVVDLWSTLKKELHVKHLIGCTAGGVIGGGHEVEEKPAVSLTVANLPDVKINPFIVSQDELPTPDQSPKKWRELMKASQDESPSFLILSDPFSLDADAFISGLDFAFPNSVKIGGLASGGMNVNENLLFTNDRVLSKGAVGVSLSGDIFVEAVVAQGCRPIGTALSITESDENILISVNNKAPLVYLQELFETLSPQDQELLQTSLFVGISMDPFKQDPKHGDFLIRNIIGVDQSKGLLAIGAQLRPGQTIQFHLRDANTSREDLQMMLSRSKSAQSQVTSPGNPAQAGAVLFSCLGRGKRLYGEADHDLSLFKSVVGDIPVGGFFCNGEIGPVGGRTYLHGYTSSIAVFSQKQTSA